MLVELGIEDSPAAWHRVRAPRACDMSVCEEVTMGLRMPCANIWTGVRRSRVKNESTVLLAVQAVEQTLLGDDGTEDVRSKIEDQPIAKNGGAGKSKRQAMQQKHQLKPQTRAKTRKLPPSIAGRA